MSMRTLADHVLDIAQNSINAAATEISLLVEQTSLIFQFSVKDNGKGMDAQTLQQIFDPFFTTRDKKIRRFGLGLPFLREAARITGGEVSISSEKGKGTEIEACFHVDHIDCQPVGDMADVFFSLLSYSNDIHWKIVRRLNGEEYDIDSDSFRCFLSVSDDFYSPRFLQLLKDSLRELESAVHNEG